MSIGMEWAFKHWELSFIFRYFVALCGKIAEKE